MKKLINFMLLYRIFDEGESYPCFGTLNEGEFDLGEKVNSLLPDIDN